MMQVVEAVLACRQVGAATDTVLQQVMAGIPVNGSIRWCSF
jgi:hypothetical protein